MTGGDKKYLDLVLLIRKTTKIESMLESLGGSGGGIWEKADSINMSACSGFMQKIIDIGTVRNNAIHGTLEVNSIDEVVQKCNEVLLVLDHRKRLNILQEKIRLKKDEFRLYNIDIQDILDSSLSEWIHVLSFYDFTSSCNAQEIKAFLEEGEHRIRELNIHVKRYIISRKLSQLPYLFLEIMALYSVYILLTKELL